MAKRQVRASNSNARGNKVTRGQNKKDSNSKRVNYDNERVSKFDKDEEKKAYPKGSKTTAQGNDVTWYARNPELLRAAASFPFSVTTGQPTDFGPVPIGTGTEEAGIPGVMAMYWTPSLGGDAMDAVNQAARSTYSYVVHANSRSSIKYSDQDLMLIIISASHLFAMVAHAIRAYGVMKTFDQRNDYLPKGLIYAMGFDYDDLKSNLSNMWFDLNDIIANTQQIWIPDSFPLTQRWFWLNTNVYMDADSVKGQYYMFVPANFGMYNELYNDQGGAVQFGTAVGGKVYNPAEATAKYTWAEYAAFLRYALNVMTASEDRGTMMGDILKAYGTEHIFALNPIPVDYRVQPVHDVEVLSQIENAVVCSVKPAAFIQDQSTARIETNWYLRGSSKQNDWISDVQVLNFHQIETPTPEQIMVATRLKPAGNIVVTSADGKFSGVYPAYTGTEYICDAQIILFANVNGKRQIGALNLPSLSYNKSTAVSSVGNLMILWAWNTFDWAPWLYIRNSNIALPTTDTAMSSTTTPEYLEAVGDYDNYTFIRPEDLKKMHTTAVYSEFGVPTI